MPDSELSLPALLPANDNAFVTVAREAKCRIDRLLSAMPDGHPQDGIIIRFDAEAFDPSLYQRFGIIRPDAIARSVVKRQAEFFYGRLAARLALAGQDMNHVNLPVGRSREPVWPAGWTGSISHTTGIAGAIVAPTGSSRCKGIGLDLERIAGVEAISAILQNALSPEEARLLTDAFIGNIEAGITIGFSAKESLYKASFAEVGAFFDFDSARIVSVEKNLGIIELVTTRPLAERIPEGMRWLLRHNSLIDGVVATHASW